MDPHYQDTPQAVGPDEAVILAAATRRVVQGAHVSRDEVMAAYAKVQARIDRLATNRSVCQQSVGRRLTRSVDASYTMVRSAGYVVAALVLGVVAVIAGRQAKGRHADERPTAAGKALVYATGNGQRATITLRDGNTVVLNVASRLEVPADYAEGNRTVRLTGEGLFTVAHRDSKPFTVVAGAVTTRVLGTSFVVRHYPLDTATTVAVRDGKVAVRSTVLTSAQQGEFFVTGASHVRRADPGQFSFASGVLTLDGVPLAAAVRELDRWYDADIRLGSPALSSLAVTGEFAAESLTDLSDILVGSLNVRVIRAGRVLTLMPR